MARSPLAEIASRAVGGRLLEAGQDVAVESLAPGRARGRGAGLYVSDGRPTIVDYIAWCHAVNFQFTFLVTGEFGAGKSTLAAWLARYFYGSWEEAERHFVYNIEDVDRLRAEAASRGRLPLIVVDDAPLQLNSREFNSPAQRLFMRSYQTVREYANTVLFVANNPEEIDVSIRKKVNGVIYVLSPLVMARYPELRAMLDRTGGRVRAAWFCILMRLPDREDPTKSYRYYVPVHGPERPFIYSPLPPDVEERLRRKKMMATERVDRLRNVLSVRRPRSFRELSGTLSAAEKRVLRCLVALHDERGGPVPAREVALRAGLPEAAVAESLLNLHSVSPALALESAGGWEPSSAGRSFAEMLGEAAARAEERAEEDLG
jgi:hypothetical protein